MFLSVPDHRPSVLEHTSQPVTYWERVATTRWGRYTTQMVEDAVRAGLLIAGEPGKALEVGCEGGRWSCLLARAGWEMTCTDVNPVALETCQLRVPSATCILVDREATSLPCRDNSVSVLLCLEVFPVIDSDWFLREANRVLTDHGVLIGVTLNVRSMRGLFVRLKHYLKPSGHGHYSRSYTEWKRAAQREGFGLQYERGYCWFPLARTSDSAWAPVFAELERLLGLSRAVALSPWVVFVAQKK
jgi:2-polyprenyl-3-methyl-5-hydroxy-6-metoxy-1,4-benzoquinol methylase